MHKKTAIELRDCFIQGSVSATEIVQHYLQRIDQLDPQIGAFLSVYSTRALEQARQLDEKRASKKPLGKLAGIPIALKDNIHVKGQISTCGSQFLTNYRAPFSSTVTRLIEEEDGILIGKTNMDEFAMGSSTENSALQKTFNPWNVDCTPGGSSGGSAAAVAARLCPIALGSDTGGSVRQPSALCGVVGFKPSYGRVSRYGLVAYGSSLDQIGPIASSTEDIGLMMEVIGKHCIKDSTSLQKPAESILDQFSTSLKGLKIGVPWQYLSDLNKEVKESFHASLQILKELGAECVEVDLSILKYSVATYYILATAEAATNLARFDGIRYGKRSKKAETLDAVYDFSRQEGFGPEVKRRILLGTFVLSAGYQDAFYRKGQKVRTLIIKKFKEAFSQCDVVVTPVSPCAAFEIGAVKDPLQMYLEDIYTIGPNLAGLPAISVPCGFTEEKKPLGLHILGPQLEDARVCCVAYAFQNKTGYHRLLPPIAHN